MNEIIKKHVTVIFVCFSLLYILPKATFACCGPPPCPSPCQICTGEVCVNDNDGVDCGIDDCKKCSGGECVYKSGNDCEETANCDGCDRCVNCKCEDRCEPDYCESCISDTCKVCGGDTSKACCNGDCYNTTTQKCCDDIGGASNRYICNSGETCCDGLCCESYECCIDGQCVDPECDNCHTVRVSIYECGHSPFDPIGTPCAIDWCIKDVLDTSTCDYDPDSSCPKSNCDTTIDSSKPGEVFLRAYDSPCPGGTVTKDIEWLLFTGCSSCGGHDYNSSCKTGSCNGDPRGPGQWRGFAYKCGCP